MKAWEIIEAIDDPSGLIHPEKHRAFAGRTHPLGRNPAFPEHQPQPGQNAANYEEVLASRQWQKILTKANQYLGIPLTRQSLPLIRSKLIQALGIIEEAEAQHKEELEALAIEIVFELPEFKSAKAAYEANRLVIDANLGEVSLEGTMTSDEPEAQQPLNPEPDEAIEPEQRPANQQRTPAEKAWMDKMVHRRHFTNAMIQGAAVSNDFAFEYGGRALDRINPELRRAYGILMVSTEIGYWMFPQDQVIAGARGEMQVGVSRVGFAEQEPEEQPEEQPEQPGQEEEELPPPRPQGRVPKVSASAKMFPVLIQELIKGMTELASLPSLPRDPAEAREVMNKTDLVDLEAWHMMLGPSLWDQFVEAVDADNERELAFLLYRRIQNMDVDQFNTFMREIYGKTPRGMQMLRQLAQRVKADIQRREQGGMGESVDDIIRALID